MEPLYCLLRLLVQGRVGSGAGTLLNPTRHIPAEALADYICGLRVRLEAGAAIARGDPEIVEAARVQTRSPDLRPEVAKMLVGRRWIHELAPIYRRYMAAVARLDIIYDESFGYHSELPDTGDEW
jgi:hypothetical protein